MLLDDLPTPCVLVEAHRLDANLKAQQARADAGGVALRPHTKTHKSIALARRQRDHGAQGLTVAKVGEAEVYVDAGFDDIRLAYEVVGREKHERLLRLMDHARLSFCVDTRAGAEAAATVYAEAGATAEVLVEVDCGYGRTGLRWDDPDLVAFARHVDALEGLRVVGILTHAGHSYYGPQADETKTAALRRVMAEERDRMIDAALRLRDAGFEGLEVSIGSTPSLRHFENRTQDGCTITEVRPGNYVFHDGIQVGLGVAGWTDCSLTVLTTVISKHRDSGGQERLFLDAGKKVFTSDTAYGLEGYGTILYNARTMTPLPHARITGLSEEHGWVRVRGGATMDVGDRVRVVPNHACVVVNTQPELYLVDGETVVGTLKVDALGRVR